MGMYLGEQESRTELQERIAAELQAKAKEKAKVENDFSGAAGKELDGVEDSAYMQGYKKTTTLAPVWAIIVVAAIIVFIYFVVQMSK